MLQAGEFSPQVAYFLSLCSELYLGKLGLQERWHINFQAMFQVMHDRRGLNPKVHTVHT